MMEKKDILIGSLFLVVLIFGVAFLLKNTSSDIWVGLIAGLSPYGITVYLQKKKEEREHYNWLLRNKEACLTEIVDMLMSNLNDTESSEESKKSKLLKKSKRLRPALILWGPPSLIHDLNALQQTSADADPEAIIRISEKLLRTIRKELGQDDSSLNPGEVLALLLKLEDKQKALDACKNESYKQVKKNANS